MLHEEGARSRRISRRDTGSTVLRRHRRCLTSSVVGAHARLWELEVGGTVLGLGPPRNHARRRVDERADGANGQHLGGRPLWTRLSDLLVSPSSQWTPPDGREASTKGDEDMHGRTWRAPIALAAVAALVVAACGGDDDNATGTTAATANTTAR